MKKLVLLILILTVFAMPISASTTWGASWQGYNEFERIIYVYGFADGIRWINYIITYKESNPEEFIMANFITDNAGTISSVMTDLYEDPANSLIKYPLICCLAIRKLKGENIERELEKARELYSGKE